MKQPVGINVNFYLSELMYSFKYGYKDKYLRALDKLKPYLDDVLYVFYYNLSFESSFNKRR